MKSMVINFGFFLMLFITSIAISSIARKQIIQEELNEAVSVSIRNTMEMWLDDKSINEEDLISNFLNVFEMNVNSKSTYNIYFYNVDTEDGLIDVEVEAKFRYLNNREGEVKVRKTMVYDEKIS